MSDPSTSLNSRRNFLATASLVAGGCLGSRFVTAEENASSEQASPWLRKTLKMGMIRVKGSWDDKFQAALDAGFEGVEPNTGDLDVSALRSAAEKTGIIIDGTVGGYHWSVTHTNPDPKIREQAQEHLENSLRQTAALGAKTMLLVPGHGKDGSPEEVRSRAFDAISKALPLADKLGVHIVIENVWNHFLYDHGGDENQSAEPLADFIASFGTDTVGVQFDLGNHWKYGDVAGWVETLGDHIQKLDIKGFSRASGGFTDITQGDIDWGSVRRALVKIDFQGWLAAEVGGGDEQRLKKVAGQMETALHCSQTFASVSAELKQPA
ncbi:sugar phosphate isomerase/epimerase family protein [Allorhodopirellula solitaria]|uniref:Endonuclease 4 n=1 Tax=Allorhodopirellula solitaria TaxID=2527987 RepID=A0A5C5YI32_9BACT|nr:sugar phosphate isomerase/epimerase family protein [Allorhodopirellula solitaria]TWT74162.1 endonuclease 4 [Allorhodopirellula solitaria]